MNAEGGVLHEVQQLQQRVARLEAILEAVLAAGGDAAAAVAGAVRAAAPAAAPPPPAPVPPDSPGPGAVPMSTTRVVMHQLVLPSDINQLGICTGGQVLSWIDVCAGLSAKTLAQGPCVTASLDAVHFLRPCRIGSVCIVAAFVARTFNTSMEVAVVVESEDMRTGLRHHCCSAHLTFVVRPHGPHGPPALPPAAAQQHGGGAAAAAAAAAGAAGSWTATGGPAAGRGGGVGVGGGGGGGLPRVYPTTPEHRAVWEGAELRRQVRLEKRQRVRRDPQLQDAERLCRLRPITHREGGPTLPPAVTLTPGGAVADPAGRRTGSGSGSRAAPARPHAPSPFMQQLHQQLNPQQHPHAPHPHQDAPRPKQDATQRGASASAASPSATPPASPSPAAAAAAAGAAADPPAPLQSSPGSQRDSRPTGHLQVALDPAAPPPLPPALTSRSAAVRGSQQPEAPYLLPYSVSMRRQLVPPVCTRAYMTQSILPQHANTLNITFGGQVMAWMEQCAYIAASRLRAPALLTAAMDSVSFVRPTRVGDILYVTAQVTAIFGSSLEVMVSVFGESPYQGAGSSAEGAGAAGGGCSGGGNAAAGAGGDAPGAGAPVLRSPSLLPTPAAAAAAAARALAGGRDASASAADGSGIFHCADAFVTVVAVDEQYASPVQVPFELDPHEPADMLRYQGAVARRAERLAMRGQFAAAEAQRVSLDGGHTYSPPGEAAEGGEGGLLEALPPL